MDLRSELKWDAKRECWFMRPYLGTSVVTGQPIRPYRSWPGTMAEDAVLEAAQAWVNTQAHAAELHVAQRLGEVLDRYVAFTAAKKAPSTARTYRSALRRYVDPYIGSRDPASIIPADIEGLYAVLLCRGALHGGGVAATTVLKTHWFLTGGWRWMMANNVCLSSPMDAVAKPSPDDVKAAAALGEADHARMQRAIREALADDARTPEAVFRRNALFAAHLALNTGMRVGECCALARSDVRLDAGIICVCANADESSGPCRRREKTKGRRSRNVSIDAGLADDIRAHIAWQASYLSPARAASGGTFVCAGPDGGIMRPSKVSAAFGEAARGLGLPAGTHFHVLRHTHATWLLMDGMDMRAIQERLGHADVATTLRIYAHLMPGRDREAAEAAARRRKRLEEAL